ncbi:Zinc finger, CCCH-type [Cinara cedri]|uniref:Zinc finger, CCCH-type n=1 Tax=Cinara cedri TaxID=506608 RepID=A0A5E4M8I9_9HEMI|nr:Zinc finger, CCCH-type [Cinara cedri]
MRKICDYYLRGYCPYGEKCNKLHNCIFVIVGCGSGERHRQYPHRQQSMSPETLYWNYAILKRKFVQLQKNHLKQHPMQNNSYYQPPHQDDQLPKTPEQLQQNFNELLQQYCLLKRIFHHYANSSQDDRVQKLHY